MNEEQLERLSDCEILINKCFNLIQDYQKASDNFSKDVVFKKDLSESLHLFKKEIVYNLEKMKNSLFELVSRVSQNEKFLDSNNQLTTNLNDCVRSLEKDINNLFSHFDFLKSKNEENVSNINLLNMKMPNRDKINQEFHDLRKTFATTFSDYDKEQNALRNQISQNKNDLNVFQGVISNHKDLNEKLYADSKIHMDKIKSFVNEMKSNHQSMVDDLKKHFENKIQNLPKPESPEFPDFQGMINAFKSELMDKLDKESQKYIKALDISLLNEIQMKVIDKKLLGILAILEKNKLS